MEDDEEGLKKQRHTAKRIYERLVEETGFTGGESTIRMKVRELKQLIPAAFIPLDFSPGEVLQVDWGEGIVYLKGNRERSIFFAPGYVTAVGRSFWRIIVKTKKAFWMPSLEHFTFSEV